MGAARSLSACWTRRCMNLSPKEEEEPRAGHESMGVTFEELNDKAISLRDQPHAGA